MSAFGEALPKIRKRVREDLGVSGLPREKVLATVVRLLDRTVMRVGNARYARENGSYGLTTMRNRHAEVSGDTIRFEFRGKGGKTHTADVRDPRLARVVEQCQEIPGQHLFQYLEDGDQRRPIESADVNSYLRDITGEDFTAKDFRTWAGTVLGMRALRDAGAAKTGREARGNVVAAIESVAGVLGNTVAVCRACYVHPAVVEAYLDGSLHGLRTRRSPRNGTVPADRLRPDEGTLLHFLRALGPASGNGDLKAALRASLSATATATATKPRSRSRRSSSNGRAGRAAKATATPNRAPLARGFRRRPSARRG